MQCDVVDVRLDTKVVRWPPEAAPALTEFYADPALPALPALLAAQLAPATLSGPLDISGDLGDVRGNDGGAPARAPGAALFTWLAIFSDSPSARPHT